MSRDRTRAFSFASAPLRCHASRDSASILLQLWMRGINEATNAFFFFFGNCSQFPDEKPRTRWLDYISHPYLEFMKANTKSAFKINVFNGSARCIGVLRKICQARILRLKRNKAFDRLRSSVLDFGGNPLRNIFHMPLDARFLLSPFNHVALFLFISFSRIYSSLYRSIMSIITHNTNTHSLCQILSLYCHPAKTEFYDGELVYRRLRNLSGVSRSI